MVRLSTFRAGETPSRTGLLACRRTRLLFHDRNLKVQQLAPRFGLAQPAEEEARSPLIARLEIEEAAGRLARRQHLGGESAALDLPGIQRVFPDDARGHPRRMQRTGTGRPVHIGNILGWRSIDLVAVWPGPHRLQGLHFDGLAAVVLNDYQHRQHPVLVRIAFAEHGARVFVVEIRQHSDGDLFTGLVRRIAGGGARRELGLLFLARQSLAWHEHHRYTREESQPFENKRHLFTLPPCSGAWMAHRSGLLPLAGTAPARLPRLFEAALRFPARVF